MCKTFLFVFLHHILEDRFTCQFPLLAVVQILSDKSQRSCFILQVFLSASCNNLGSSVGGFEETKNLEIEMHLCVC